MSTVFIREERYFVAVKFNMPIDQGADYTTTFNITDDNGVAVDMSTYSGNGMIRKSYSSSNSFALGVTANNANGLVVVTLSANTSAAMSAGRYVYDIKVTDSVSNIVSRIAEGIVTINPQVTR